MDELEAERQTYRDFAGRERRFRTVLRETPGGLSAEAVEEGAKEGGYRFRVVVPRGAQGRAYWELNTKVARVLNTRHIERQPVGDAWSPTHDILRGRIDSDPETGRPVIVIDGEILDWDVFGKMLLTHEGFEFELRFTE